MRFLKSYGLRAEKVLVKKCQKGNCQIARKELGKTSGKVSTAGRRESWWCDQEAQEKLKDKKKAKKAWDTIRDDASKLAYKTARKQAKREVAKARNKAYEELYEKLETKEGEMRCSK